MSEKEKIAVVRKATVYDLQKILDKGGAGNRPSRKKIHYRVLTYA